MFIYLKENILIRFRFIKGGIKKMANENVATMKADAKKTVSDLENIMSHAKADAEKAKAA